MTTAQDDMALDKRTHLRDYRSPAFAVDDITLHIDLRQAEVVVTSELHIHRVVDTESTPHLQLDGDELVLRSILLNDRPLGSDEYRDQKNGLTVFNVPDEFTLKITVILCPEKNKQLMGLYRSRNFICTQCEPEGFRRIMYFLDRPDVLSRYRVTIEALKDQYPCLLSNGNLIAAKEYQDENGQFCHQWVWEDPYLKSSYLFAMVAGDFDCLEDHHITTSGKHISLYIYVEKGYREQAQFAMQALKAAMAWDEQAYGCEYDLEAYRIVAIDDFNMGAMENKGLNIFNSKYILADVHTATDQNILAIFSVVSHEYFHNWSGNRVTCRDWFQLSLKEGLTIFRDQCFLQDLLSEPLMRIKDVMELKSQQFVEDQSTAAHSVRPESYLEISNFYTATIYNKGAEVLRMLQTWMGRSAFNAGIRAYFKEFDGHAVTIENLLNVLENHTQKSLNAFHDWYNQIGTPRVEVERIEQQKGEKTLILAMRQSLAHAHKNTVSVVPIPVRCAFFDEAGHPLMFRVDGEHHQETVFLLDSAEKTWLIEDVEVDAVPSLFRGFSAPVNYSYDYSIEEWMTLAKHETDGFNQWYAFSQCLLSAIKSCVLSASPLQFQFPVWVSDLVLYYLNHGKHDAYFLSELLTLPSVSQIFDELSPVDRERITVDVCYAARQALVKHLAEQLKVEWQALYLSLQANVEELYSLASAGTRRLKNACLVYLSYLPENRATIEQQFTENLPRNMTDALSALTCLSLNHPDSFQQALMQFHQYFAENRLVMDKWLMVQAMVVSEHTLEHVKRLVNSPVFDLYNPNRVYALIGSFVERNPVCFHRIDGLGYQFLAELIVKIDQFNSTLSARLVKPLTAWPRYDSKRQTLMRQQLRFISEQSSLSKDVRELIGE